MDFVIETEAVTGGYGATMVLNALSLQVPRASVFGFLGREWRREDDRNPHAARSAAAHQRRDPAFGQPLREALPERSTSHRSIDRAAFPYDHLTGRENLEIVRRLKGLERRDAERAIEALHIGEYVGNRVEEYSRGMRQRLGVAIAVLGNPELLLLDEPMNGLDAGGLETFRTLVEMLREEYGTTILISSHQLDELDLVATHIGIMNHTGDLLFQGTREELAVCVPQELIIEVDRWDDARRVLASSGHAVDCRRGDFVIRGATRDTAREVNRLLVESGVGVHRLAIELATLEALFTKVTGSVKAWSSR